MVTLLYTSVWSHWRYLGEEQRLSNAARVLEGLCDLRLPLALTRSDCQSISAVIRAAMDVAR